MSAESVLSVVTILILVPLCGVIFALTPWLTPKGELFSVSVPTAAASDPRARSLKRAYSLWVLVVTALLTGWVSYVLVAIHPNMAALVSCVAVVVLVLFGYFLMLHYRDKAQDLKQARGWKARGRKSAAVLSGEGVPKPVPLSWELLNLLPIAASIMVAVLGYDSAPDPIPIHAGMDGVVNGWAEKSVQVMLLPMVFQLAMAGTMTISHAMLLGSKRPIDPRRPASSAFAYGAYVHAWSACCVGIGLAVNASGVVLEASLVDGCRLTLVVRRSRLLPWPCLSPALCSPCVMGRTEPGFSCDFRRTLHFPQMTTTAGTGACSMPTERTRRWWCPSALGLVGRSTWAGRQAGSSWLGWWPSAWRSW